MTAFGTRIRNPGPEARSNIHTGLVRLSVHRALCNEGVVRNEAKKSGYQFLSESRVTSTTPRTAFVNNILSAL